MRAIKKKIQMKTVKCHCYNTKKKEEVEIELKMAEFQKTPTLPNNHVLINMEEVEVKEVSYTMTMSQYLEHATIVEE